MCVCVFFNFTTKTFDTEIIIICWIVIYPVDSVIQPTNNRGLVFSGMLEQSYVTAFIWLTSTGV